MAVKTERFIGLGQTLLHCKALTIIFKIGYGKTISHNSQISPNCEFFPSWAHCETGFVKRIIEPYFAGSEHFCWTGEKMGKYNCRIAQDGLLAANPTQVSGTMGWVNLLYNETRN